MSNSVHIKGNNGSKLFQRSPDMEIMRFITKMDGTIRGRKHFISKMAKRSKKKRVIISEEDCMIEFYEPIANVVDSYRTRRSKF